MHYLIYSKQSDNEVDYFVPHFSDEETEASSE